MYKSGYNIIKGLFVAVAVKTLYWDYQFFNKCICSRINLAGVALFCIGVVFRAVPPGEAINFGCAQIGGWGGFLAELRPLYSGSRFWYCHSRPRNSDSRPRNCVWRPLYCSSRPVCCWWDFLESPLSRKSRMQMPPISHYNSGRNNNYVSG
jgi:hypothetical protein